MYFVQYLCTYCINLLLYCFVFFTHDIIVILEDWTSKCSASLTEIQSQIVSAQIKKTQRVTQNQQTETEVPLLFNFHMIYTSPHVL